MTEQEVRRYLRQMKEEDSERAFHSFYNLCYDRLFRIACYFVKHEEWAQEIVLDVFMKLWELWGIERSGFFNGREKWAKGFENQRV